MNNNFSILIVVALIAASCGNAKKDREGNLTDKKVQLQELQNQQKKTAEEIAKLEAEIRKMDPTAINTSAKLVGVMPLSTDNFSHYIELQGRIDATNISYVAPPNGVGGIVKSLHVTQGQAVRKGQLLAQLDDQLIRQQTEPLRVQLKTATDTYNRTKNLWDQGIGTYQQVLTAKTQMESLQEQIALIQRQAAQMRVTAPSSGVADVVNVRVGEMFTGNSAAGPQIRIVNTSNLKVIASVPENYAGRVSVGSKLEVVLPENNNRVINAVVNVVQKVIDPNTRSFNIEARIPSNSDLKPNQIAQIKILDYSAANALSVPLNVIQSDEKGKYVYVMAKEGDKNVARKRTVIVGQSNGDRIEVRSGLKAGDQLITEGYQNLYDGQLITTSLARI